MKKEIKGFIVGVVTTSILLMTPFAMAQEIRKTIDVVFNSINLTVNGQSVKADNILYGGTTYVPLRAIAEMLNKEVGWDGDTKTASIMDKGDYINEDILSPKEALDQAREYVFGSNASDLLWIGDTNGYIGYSVGPNFYFDLDNYDEETGYYLVHYYEVVRHGDMGHTATFNWYEVDGITGEVIPMF